MGLLNSLACRQIHSIDIDCTLQEAITKMREEAISSILVRCQGKYIGIITERDLVRAAATGIEYTKAFVKDIMTKDIISLTNDTLLDEALLVMETKRIRHLLVTDIEGYPLGVITHTDIVRKLEEDFFKAPRPVSEYMSVKIEQITSAQPLKTVIEIMHERKISSLIVADDGYPVGIVTERDVVKFMQLEISESTPINQLMSSPIITVDPTVSLFEASRLMEKHMIRHLVVWNGVKIVGLVTNTDVVKSIRDNYRSYLEKEAMRTRRILDLIHEGVIEIECDECKIVWINQTGAEMLGYQRIQQAIGHNFLQLIDEVNRKIIEADFQEFKSRNNLQCKVESFRGNQIEQLTILLSYHVVTEDSNYGKSYRILMRDITNMVENRRIMEERLRRQKKQFQALFDNTTDAIVFFDINKRIQMANNQFFNLFGYKMEEVIGEHISYLVNPQQLVADHISDNVFSGEYVNKETIRYTKLGKKLQVLLKGGPVIVDGEITGGYAVYSDITERKHMLFELKNSESKHRNLIQTMSEGMALLELVYDENGCAIDYSFIETNPAFEIHTGITIDRVCGRVGSDLFKMKNPPFLKEFETTVKTGLPQKLETYIESIDRHIRMSVFSPMQGYFATLFEDITEQKRKEEKIEYLIYHDVLTDIYNRAYFERALKDLDVEENLPISIVMADLNNLKLINDVFGHDKGDELIKSAAKVIKSVCDDKCVPARIGGDEFAIILPNTNRLQGEKFVEKLGDLIDKYEIEGVQLSISLGLATKDTMDSTIYDTVQQSDVQMYNQKLHESHRAKDNLINSMLLMMEQKTLESRAHCRRVMELGVMLGEAYGLTEDDLERLRILALLHDIGTITISESILKKPTSLTSEEWSIIKKHSEIGYRIVKSIPEFAHIAEDLLNHHERMDGKGYPRGLKSHEISTVTKILSIADAYEVMTRTKIYRPAISKDEAIKELIDNAGTQFDEELVELFINKVVSYV